MQVSLRIVLLVAAFLLIGGGAYLAFAQLHGGLHPVGVACTTEALICPDGTAVGRTGPNCTFAPCPSVATTTLPVATSTPALPVITRDDGNTTIYVKQDQDFQVALGGGLRWTIAFDPASSVTLVSGADASASSQGVYKATVPGTITLRGTGAPICNPGQACPDFLVAFTTTIVVE